MAATLKTESGDTHMSFSRMLGKGDIHFLTMVAADPKAVETGIGPQPDASKDFSGSIGSNMAD